MNKTNKDYKLWSDLCAELLSIENEIEFRKQNNLDITELTERSKQINQQLEGLKGNERSKNE